MNYYKTVLLGSAGTGTAFAAACALRRVWSHKIRIVAMDIHPHHLVTTSLLADRFHQVPVSSDPTFQLALLDIVRQDLVDTYLPLFPVEITLAAGLIDQKQFNQSVTVVGPSTKAAKLCEDKLALSEILAKSGVLTPKTTSAAAPLEAGELFLKPRCGTGSQGARKVKRDEVAAIVGDSAESWLVQEICSAPEVTVDAFVDPKTSFIRVICRERVEIKTGVSTKCRLFEDPELSLYASRIAKIFNFGGSFCFQVMRSPDGWAVTDVNPRPGAATAMCAASGNDFFAAAFAYCWGQDAQKFFRPLCGEEFVTRQYSEFLMRAKS